MGSLWLILALGFSLLIAIVAVANQQPVEVNYLFGRAEVYLIVLILGSAITGALSMGLFSLFRGISSAIKFREERRLREEVQRQVATLEQEKLTLEAELGRALSRAQESLPGESGKDKETGEAGESGEDGGAAENTGTPLPDEESEPEQQDR